jgi:hypothetical protein
MLEARFGGHDLELLHHKPLNRGHMSAPLLRNCARG